MKMMKRVGSAAGWRGSGVVVDLRKFFIIFKGIF
jgi:hypothetical protein